MFGKTTWFAALALACAGALSAGEAAKTLADGYEDQVPGTAPKGWGVAWGKEGKGDDRIVVTNEKAASGDNALLVEHNGANVGQWGMALTLPRPDGDAAAVSFKFQIDGAGGGFSAEIRDGNGKDRLSSFNVGNSRLTAWVDGKKKFFGKIENGAWYAVTLRFPLAEAAGKTARLEVVNIATGDAVTEDLNAGAPQAFGKLFINIPPKSPDFRLYLDDIEVK